MSPIGATARLQKQRQERGFTNAVSICFTAASQMMEARKLRRYVDRRGHTPLVGTKEPAARCSGNRRASYRCLERRFVILFEEIEPTKLIELLQDEILAKGGAGRGQIAVRISPK